MMMMMLLFRFASVMRLGLVMPHLHISFCFGHLDDFILFFINVVMFQAVPSQIMFVIDLLLQNRVKFPGSRASHLLHRGEMLVSVLGMALLALLLPLLLPLLVRLHLLLATWGLAFPSFSLLDLLFNITLQILTRGLLLALVPHLVITLLSLFVPLFRVVQFLIVIIREFPAFPQSFIRILLRRFLRIEKIRQTTPLGTSLGTSLGTNLGTSLGMGCREDLRQALLLTLRERFHFTSRLSQNLCLWDLLPERLEIIRPWCCCRDEDYRRSKSRQEGKPHGSSGL